MKTKERVMDLECRGRVFSQHRFEVLTTVEPIHRTFRKSNTTVALGKMRFASNRYSCRGHRGIERSTGGWKMRARVCGCVRTRVRACIRAGMRACVCARA